MTQKPEFVTCMPTPNRDTTTSLDREHPLRTLVVLQWQTQGLDSNSISSAPAPGDKGGLAASLLDGRHYMARKQGVALSPVCKQPIQPHLQGLSQSESLTNSPLPNTIGIHILGLRFQHICRRHAQPIAAPFQHISQEVWQTSEQNWSTDIESKRGNGCWEDYSSLSLHSSPQEASSDLIPVGEKRV